MIIRKVMKRRMIAMSEHLEGDLSIQKVMHRKCYLRNDDLSIQKVISKGQ